MKPEVEGAFPPMGILYVAAALRRTGDYEIRVVDTSFRGFRVAELERTLREFRPDVVGISAITPEATSLHSIATEVKHHLPDTVVVAGGPHPTYYTDQVLRDAAIDFVVNAEGEESFGELLQALRGEFPVEEVRGIAYRQGNAIVRTPPRPALSNLDAIPFPAWDLVEAQGYATLPTMSVRISHEPYMVLVTSRGCPFKCTYCHDMHTKTFRARSPENVLEEMEWLIRKYGVREFEIIDDIFNFDLERAKCILEEVLRQGISAPLYFGNGLRPERIDEEFLRLLKRVGTEWICFGIDSGVPRIQKLVRRNLDLQKTAETIRLCRKLGFFTKGNFIIGFPTETEDEIKKTIQYMIDSDLDAVYLSYLTPIPGSQIGREHKEELSKEEVMYDGHTYMLITKNYSAVDVRRLEALRNEALWKFYFSKKCLVRRPPLPLRDLDAVPFPAWDLLELRAYARYPSMGLMSTRPYMAIITSRGCPYRCVYCHDVHGKRFRARSVENVLKEMEVLYGDYGIRDFRIVDDIFNFNLKRAKDILGGIVERGLNVELQFPNGIRADRADGELIEKMVRAGTRQLSVAVETVSSLGQKRIRKFLKVEKVEETIHEAAARGIYTQGFFMLGLPGEGREEMQETIEFAARSKLHTALFFIATPYEGTEMADMVREKTAGISKGFEQYDSLVPSFNLSEVSHAELRALWRSAYRRFYASPQRLYRIVRDYPRKKELMAIWLSSLSRGIRRRLGFIRLLRTRGSRQSPLSLPALKQAPNPR